MVWLVAVLFSVAMGSVQRAPDVFDVVFQTTVKNGTTGVFFAFIGLIRRYYQLARREKVVTLWR